MDTSYEMFVSQGLDANAGLRPKLTSDLEKHPGQYRVLDGRFMAVQQAVGCLKAANGATDGVDFLQAFVDEAVASGMIQGLIDKHSVTGKLTVAMRS